jgi:polar amino acid transport system substrate-binding protein
MTFHFTFRTALVLALAAAAVGTAHADATLDKIKQRGKLAVGVDAPEPPFGLLDTATGKVGGFQTELARDIAKRLGVELEVVPVHASTRVQFLQAGKVDLLIANIQWTQERSEILSFAPTPYNLVGGAAIVAKNSGITRWEDLRGKVACVSQGSNFARPLQETYGAAVKGLKGIPESLLALKGGTCAASVHIQPAMLQTLTGASAAEWKDFRLATDDQLIPSPHRGLDPPQRGRHPGLCRPGDPGLAQGRHAGGAVGQVRRAGCVLQGGECEGAAGPVRPGPVRGGCEMNNGVLSPAKHPPPPFVLSPAEHSPPPFVLSLSKHSPDQGTSTRSARTRVPAAPAPNEPLLHALPA